MKKLGFLLLSTLLLFAACKKDDDDIQDGEVLLNYDGDNATGPNLAAGNYETAVRFPASTMTDHTNKTLKEVRWFMGNKPASCQIKIYGSGTSGTPGNLLYEVNVSGQIRDNDPQWYSHSISDVIEVDGGDLWVSIAFEHTVQMQSIGCDAGPRRTNGDWILDPALATDWATYEQRTSESVNWNIRLVAGE